MKTYISYKNTPSNFQIRISNNNGLQLSIRIVFHFDFITKLNEHRKKKMNVG